MATLEREAAEAAIGRVLQEHWHLPTPEGAEPLAPYGGSSPAMTELTAALRSGGVLPFVNFNRVHVVPPLNIPDEDLQAGLDVLDEALSVADAHAG